MTWREFLNALAVAMVFTVVLVVYGYWPRARHHISTDAELTEDSDPASAVVTNISYYRCGPEVFADNFDSIPGEDLDEVIDRLIEVENPNRDPNAVGDKHLRHKAYGLLQIRQPYLDDANRIAGTSYTIKDMKDPDKARAVAKVYLRYYGSVYERKTGNAPNLEVYARIHNGGPLGWQKASTNEYVNKLNGEE